MDWTIDACGLDFIKALIAVQERYSLPYIKIKNTENLSKESLHLLKKRVKEMNHPEAYFRV